MISRQFVGAKRLVRVAGAGSVVDQLRRRSCSCRCSGARSCCGTRICACARDAAKLVANAARIGVVALENAEALSLKADFIRGDLFENVTGKFDILVSNPPYIRTCEIEELEPEVRDHDPFIALNGHENGLYFYERIIRDCPQYLNRGAYVFFEIGCEQGRDVSALMEAAGFKEVEVRKDLAGLDRVVCGIYSKG